MSEPPGLGPSGPLPPGEPPLPGGFPDGLEPPPPPPGLAQRLVSKSKFVVYEGGASVFDESVLVYVARPRKQWPDFDVYDHVGQLLAFSRAQRQNQMLHKRSETVYLDHRNNEILRLRPSFGLFNFSFGLSGVANGEFTSGATSLGALTISANNERYGKLAAHSRLQDLTASSLRILDHDDHEVGAIKAFRAGGLFSTVHHYVVSVEPGLGGELRRMLVVLPTAIAAIRRHRQR